MERLQGCARCHGEGHDSITFQPLAHPYVEDNGQVMTHWAPCPMNGEPILYGTSPVMLTEDLSVLSVDQGRRRRRR
jgi:hypothetical protein